MRRGLTVGLALLLLGLSVFAMTWIVTRPLDDPLARLEAAAREHPAWLADYIPPTTAELGESERRLYASAARLGIEVVVEATDSTGLFTRKTRRIRLDPQLKLDARVQVLAHELGHALAPPDLSEPEEQVFADAVSFLVVRHQRDDLETYAAYLARFRTSLHVIHLYAEEIRYAAEVLWGPE